MSTEVAQLPSATPDQTVKPWSTPRVIAFRALFCFFILIDFPFPMSLFPGIQRLLFWYETAYLALSVWVGKSIFHLKYISTARNGSGDKTTDYLALFCIVVITLVATLIWSIVDRKRRHGTTLFEFLTVYVRFALAVALISYGMYKIVPSQFPAPTLAALTETYGESSPMHLLWTFMGFSPAYNVFAGSCELLAGLLLMSRRTTPLGSAIAAAVLLNIVMLNFCYDVPVKIYSCELLAQALFLLAPHMHRLAAVFVLNRRAEPVLLAPRFTRRSLKIAHFVLKACLISFVLFTTARQSVAQRSRMQSVLLKPPLYGFYDVQKIAFIGAGSSALRNQTPPWSQIAFCYSGFALIKNSDGSRGYVRMGVDARHSTLTLSVGHAADKFRYSAPDPQQLNLDGTLEGLPAAIQLRRVDGRELLLEHRGFHWINDFPLNR